MIVDNGDNIISGIIKAKTVVSTECRKVQWQDNGYGAFIMAKLLQEFTRLT